MSMMETGSTQHQSQRDSATSLRVYEEKLETDGFALFDVTSFGGDDREVAALFGTIIPQYGGEETYAVAYSQGFDEFLYSKSLNPIGPHTEAPLFSPPPRLLALHCKRQARCGGGATLIADARTFLLERPAAEVELCRTWPIAFLGSPDPGHSETIVAEAPLLSESRERPIVRFSHNFFIYGDTNARLSSRRDLADLNLPEPLESAIRATFRFFEEQAVPITIPEGYMLIWDNHRMLHGRTGFQDPGRHLTRYWLS